MIAFDNLDKRNKARAIVIHNLTFPKETETVPFFAEDWIVSFAKAPCAWSVYKAQMLEFYFYLMRSREVAPVRFYIAEVGSIELCRGLVRSLLEDCITREFLDMDPEEIE